MLSGRMVKTRGFLDSGECSGKGTQVSLGLSHLSKRKGRESKEPGGFQTSFLERKQGLGRLPGAS